MQTRLKALLIGAAEMVRLYIWRSLFVGYVSLYGIFRTGIVHQDSLPIHWRFHYIVYGSSSFAFIFRVCFDSFLARSAQSKFENVARTPSVGYTIYYAQLRIHRYSICFSSSKTLPLFVRCSGSPVLSRHDDSWNGHVHNLCANAQQHRPHYFLSITLHITIYIF